MFVFEAWLIQCSILRRLEIQYLHPRQILIRHSRLHEQISQVPRSLEEKHRMMYYLANFHLRCWFLRPAIKLPSKTVQSSANQFYRKQRYQMSRERLICVNPRTTRRILGQKLAFFSNSAMFGIKRNLRNQAFYVAFYLCWGLGRQMTTVLSVSAQITTSCMAVWRSVWRRSIATCMARRMTLWSFVFLCRFIRDCHPLKKYGMWTKPGLRPMGYPMGYLILMILWFHNNFINMIFFLTICIIFISV